jgi:hypothetical protein
MRETQVNDTTNIAALIRIATEAGACFDVRYKGEVTFISQDALVRFVRALLASSADQKHLFALASSGETLQAITQTQRDREADRNRFPDPLFNKWLDEGISDSGHTVWDQIGDTQAAWQGWENRVFYIAQQPAISQAPQGWKLVPIAPTENMIVHGFESAPDPYFSTPELLAEYDKMTGCQQAAFRAKLCWAAMLDAAPEYARMRDAFANSSGSPSQKGVDLDSQSAPLVAPVEPVAEEWGIYFDGTGDENYAPGFVGGYNGIVCYRSEGHAQAACRDERYTPRKLYMYAAPSTPAVNAGEQNPYARILENLLREKGLPYMTEEPLEAWATRSLLELIEKAGAQPVDAQAPVVNDLQQAQHYDDYAVDRFAAAMKAKLAKKRADGRGGWETPDCTDEFLAELLMEHTKKGDPVDVANFAMMLHQRNTDDVGIAVLFLRSAALSFARRVAPMFVRQADAPDVKSRVNILRERGCFWHLNCEKSSSGIMQEIKREPDKSLFKCLHCDKRGYYPVGAAGEVCAEEVKEQQP